MDPQSCDREGPNRRVGASRAELAHLAFVKGKWAGFLRRLAASFIDGLILCCAIGVEVAVFLWLKGDDDEEQLEDWARTILYLTFALSVILFHAVFVGSRWVATPGRVAVGIAVLDARTGASVGLGRALLRAAFSMLAFCLILPNLIVPFIPRKRSIADLAARTVVVQYRPGGSAAVSVVLGVTLGVPLLCFLAAFGLIEYRDYEMRKGVEETRRDLAVYARLVEKKWRATGETPKSLGDLGFAPPRKYAEFSIREDGVITAKLREGSGGIVLRPDYDKQTDSLAWTCFAYGLGASPAINDCEEMPR